MMRETITIKINGIEFDLLRHNGKPVIVEDGSLMARTKDSPFLAYISPKALPF